MIAGQAFLSSFFPLIDKSMGLQSLPFPGGYRDQPADLMEILQRLVSAVRRSP